MNLWLIAGLVIGLLAVGGFVIAETVIANEDEQKIECSSCSNSCNSDSNCGLSGCKANLGQPCGCLK